MTISIYIYDLTDPIAEIKSQKIINKIALLNLPCFKIDMFLQIFIGLSFFL